jgi:hypothetical protein
MSDHLSEPSPEQDPEGALLRMLDEAHELPPWLVPLWAARHATALGASEIKIYLHDYEQRILVPLSEEAVGSEVLGTLSIDETAAGRAYTHSEQLASPADDGSTVLWTPLLDGTDRVGVLAVCFPELTDARRLLARRLAAVTTNLVLAKGGHTDVFFRARRTRAMTLAPSPWPIASKIATCAVSWLTA